MPKVFLETCAGSGFWARGGAAGAGEAGQRRGQKVTPEALGSGPGSAAEAELRATRCLPRCEESPVCSPGERGRDREVTLRAGVLDRGKDVRTRDRLARVKAFPSLRWRLPKSPARAVGAGPGFCPSADGAVGGRGRGGGSLPAGSPPIVAPGALPSTPPPDSAAGRGPSAGSLTRARLPSCHLPLQSISGSCMWVTQQHCSQAQEAAAEL